VTNGALAPIDIPGVTEPFTLISASCTTGWLDWIHGTLWLGEAGLLRTSVGFTETLSHGTKKGLKRTIGAERPIRTIDVREIPGLVDADKRNRWIVWGEIEHATLKLGIIDHSLHLDVRPGSAFTVGPKAKFLWPKIDGGFELLEAALRQALGDRFVASRRLIG
jgi:hypothetical protein